MTLEDIKIYLPKFLSSLSEKELFESISEFPDSLDQRFYTNYLKKEPVIYQGDGINDLLIINLPNPEIKPAPGIILSNTCDIDPTNDRLFPSQIMYAPIFNLEKYQSILFEKSNKSNQQILDHIKAIKNQEITQIFYLPESPGTLSESLVFLDRIINFPNNMVDRNKITTQRIFTLSDYGAYLFVLKLSIHFTRIKDQVERKSTSITE
ncbi:hypothetical protein OU798_15975 [Prolixibacteraceae bacterium Z1-6]|uniref:Uncharacterized protein n=1 Tax=Draconibacterium aestuarii TaxID=2998507 RepID=A0A9X3FFN3_9BACT|nr:hypothetical protein [Prolixibacteraceae bacterium Z1-6]